MIHRILMILSLILFSSSLFAKPIIIFDAGSTGTRIYIYDVNGTEAKQLHSTKIKPGLSQLSPHLYTHYFKLLLDSANGILDDASKAQTPMYLYATSGVRMLSQAQQHAIFEGTEQGPGIRAVLTEQAQTFGYPVPADEQVRVISGTEEGMFVWISDNYLSGSFAEQKLSPANTVAALEMGGASTEIAFLSQKALHYTLPMPHKGTLYPVYSYGYDGLGANQALERMKRSFTQKKNKFPACFPVGAPYPMEPGKAILSGEGQFNTCVKAIKTEFVDRTAHHTCQVKNGGDCSNLGVYQPPITSVNRYVLTDGFYYLFDFLNLANTDVKIPEFVAEAQHLCSSEWSQLQEQDPTHNPYLINYCFNAALAKAMLDLLHVNKTAVLYAADSIQDNTLEWPLGAALSLGQ